MAFDTAQSRIVAIEKVGNVLGRLRTVYAYGVQLRDVVALYQAGTDPVFNAAFNAVFSAADRSEMAAMIATLGTTLTDWETNHATALNLTP